jgi:hypothetical protein
VSISKLLQVVVLFFLGAVTPSERLGWAGVLLLVIAKDRLAVASIDTVDALHIIPHECRRFSKIWEYLHFTWDF